MGNGRVASHESIPIYHNEISQYSRGYPNVLKYWGHLKTIHFPFGTNAKLMVSDVSVLKHIRVNKKKNAVLRFQYCSIFIKACSELVVFVGNTSLAYK